MAVVRCPLCGKPNPAELEVCQYCQARLKPLRITPESQPPAESLIPYNDEKVGESEKDLPEWLNSLQDIGEKEQDQVFSEETPIDWLSGLRDQSPSQEFPSEPLLWQGEINQEATDPSDEIPPWLKELRSQAISYPEEKTGELEETPLPVHDSDEEADWLARIPGMPENKNLPQESKSADHITGPDKPSELGIRAEAESLSESGKPTGELDARTYSEQVGSARMSDHEAPTGTFDSESGVTKTLGSKLLKRLFRAEQPPDSLSKSTEKIEDGSIPQPSKAQDTSQHQESTDKDLTLEAKPDGGEGSPIQALDRMTAREEARAFSEMEKDDRIPEESSYFKGVDESGRTAGENQDWLSELEAAYIEAGEEPTPETIKSDQWLASLGTKQAREIKGEKELPNWLDDMPGTTLKDHEGSDEPDLAPAQLPAWLEAMRPVETVEIPTGVSEDSASQVEIAGPLAGLQGILPAEPEMAIGQKPAAYTMKLQVSEIQQNQAAIFEQIIRIEGEYRPLPGRPLVTSHRIMRIVLAAALLLVILIPLFSANPQVVSLALPPPEILATNQLVSSLAVGSPVLVAVDYEPGFTGEMDAALAAVVDHLMIQGTFLVLTSTSPTGPIQAEHLVLIANQIGNHQYTRAEDRPKYVNLGFIAGGPVGLRSFAKNPRSTIAFTIEGEPAWQAAALQNITDIRQFSMVIVATENFNKARSWLEQVQPHLESTPLIFVTSAQAEPLIRPFYDANPRQVQGLVSGLAGSVNYGNSIGRTGIAHSYWSSFNSGLILAAVWIVIGGGLNALFAVMAGIRVRNAGRKLP